MKRQRFNENFLFNCYQPLLTLTKLSISYKYFVCGKNYKYFKGYSTILLTTGIYISNSTTELMANILFVSNESTLKEYHHDNQANSGMLMHFDKFLNILSQAEVVT